MIKCHDSNLPEWQKDSWHWQYSGESLYHWQKNMLSPAYELDGSKLKINA